MLKTCIICKKDIKVKPSHFNKVRTCSQICNSKRKKIIYSGKNNPNYKNISSIKKICPVCNKEFEPGFHHKTRKYCSYSCSGKIAGKSKKTLKLPTKRIYKEKAVYYCACGNLKSKKSKGCKDCFRLPSKNCPNCGKEFWKTQNKFCCRACYAQHKSITSNRELNNNWKGGAGENLKRIRTSEIYIQWRKDVFKRDMYTCQECGQIGNELHAHHIDSFSEYPNKRVDINNGKTLCRKCHSNYHPILK